MEWFDLDEGSSFKMLGLSFSSKLDWVLILSLCDTSSKKMRASILSLKFLFSDVVLYLFKKSSNFGWNIVVMSGSVLLIAT